MIMFHQSALSEVGGMVWEQKTNYIKILNEV